MLFVCCTLNKCNPDSRYNAFVSDSAFTETQESDIIYNQDITFCASVSVPFLARRRHCFSFVVVFVFFGFLVFEVLLIFREFNDSYRCWNYNLRVWLCGTCTQVVSNPDIGYKFQ